MNKEIENAIEQLQHTISIFEDIEDDGNLEIDFIDVIAIKILINYIKDSTPNSVIIEKKEWLENNILDNDYTSDIDKDIAEYKVMVLEEILKEGEKK